MQARVELERTLDAAYHRGARRIAAWARAELIAAQPSPDAPRSPAVTRSPPASSVWRGSPRMASPNREIAQALFITTKTAKAHLNRVYRKLDITRRGQLADALAGQLSDTAATSANTAISQPPQKIGPWRPMRMLAAEATLLAISHGRHDRPPRREEL